MEKTAICKLTVNLSFNFLRQKWRSGIEVLRLSIQNRKIEKKKKKKYSLLWPNLEFNIEVINTYSLAFCCC